MSTVSELAEAAAALSLEEQHALLARLSSEVRAREAPPLTQPRVLGLHRGKVWMADDFNAPLPDEFWLGEDAYTGKDPADPAP